jgi:outer membrane protein assembly factor BamB
MHYILTVVLFVSSFSFVAADEIDPEQQWPQWRGPSLDGTSSKANPPLTWDASTNVAWKTPLDGHGNATPIVWGNQVFVTTAIATGRKAKPEDIPKPDPRFGEKRTESPDTYHRFAVLALDRNTGKVLWQKTCAEKVPHEGHHKTHSYAGASPLTDGERVVVSFGSFGIYCFDLKGNLLWEKQLGRQETRRGWGEAVTPALYEGRVYVNWDHEGDSFLTALDATDGKTLWKVDRDEPSSWATPLVVEHQGKTQIITPGTTRVRSYNAETGKVIWHHDGLTVNCIPSPIKHQDSVVVMSGYRGSVATAIPLDSRENATGQTIWKLERGTPYVPSPVLVDGRLYFTQSNSNILTCVDATTGKILIDRTRLGALQEIYASPVAAAERIYFTDRGGTTVVIKQSDQLEVLATNKLGEGVDASLALAGNQIFLRSEKHVWCIEDK